MTADADELIKFICQSINAVKKTAHAPESLTQSTYLGGDLGIDSIEMLEIWFMLGKALEIKISDADKRDIYMIGQVVEVLQRYLTTAPLSHSGATHPAE